MCSKSFEGESMQIMSTALPAFEELPQETIELLSQLRFLDDAGLWQAACTRLSPEQAERLEQLNLRQQREGLTPDEQQERDQLLRRYEQTMLVRAQAAVLLQERGHDVSEMWIKAGRRLPDER